MIMLTLAFVPDLPVLIKCISGLKLGDGIAVGTILIGVAYFVGILTDRMIDDSFEAMERHNRVRFACDQLTQWTESDWKTTEYKDPYPEDQYKYQVMIKAKTVNDFLDYLRTRIRLMRALAFLLPGLVYSSVLNATYGLSGGEGRTAALCIECSANLLILRIPFDLSHISGWLTGPEAIIVAYLSVGAVKFIAGYFDPIRTIGREIRDGDDIVHKFQLQKEAFEWSRSSCRLFVLAGRWQPADTRKHKEMRVYAAERLWMTKQHVRRYVLGDIGLQPFTVMAVGLFVLSINNGLRCSNPKAVIPMIVIGALVEVSAVWAWWRITRTFMDYLRGTGEFLQKPSGSVVT